MSAQRDSPAPYDDSPIPSAWQRRIERLEEQAARLDQRLAAIESAGQGIESEVGD